MLQVTNNIPRATSCRNRKQNHKKLNLETSASHVRKYMKSQAKSKEVMVEALKL